MANGTKLLKPWTVENVARRVERILRERRGEGTGQRYGLKALGYLDFLKRKGVNLSWLKN